MLTLFILAPFYSLTADNHLGQGAAGQVYAINEHVVFKCPTAYKPSEPPVLPRHIILEMKHNVQDMENEKRIYALLRANPHPNLLSDILTIPEGIFLPRLETNLAERLKSSSPDEGLKERWISQLVSAAAWLERLGYVHGDLRPHNILLDKSDNIRVADFDKTIAVGDELQAMTAPYCKFDENNKPPPAGPESEQFSIGSCIYTIRFGFAPWSNLDVESPVWRQQMIKKEYPDVSGDRYGAVIQSCWNGSFASITELQREVIGLSSYLVPSSPSTSYYGGSWYLLSVCQGFLIRERLRTAGSILTRLQLRLRLLLWNLIGAGSRVLSLMAGRCTWGLPEQSVDAS